MRLAKRLAILSVLVASLLAVVAYWVHHQRMHEHPERIYPHYSRELEDYGQRLANGDIHSEPNRGYAIPQFLIDKGAKIVTKHGSCFAVWFTSLLDNPTPVLWYSPSGFDPVPQELAKVVAEPRAKWQQLSPTWAACYLPWWLNP